MTRKKQPTTAELGLWAQNAERGESFVYGRESFGSRPATGVMDAARQLQKLGLVALVRKRDGDGWLMVAQRTWKPHELTQDRRPVPVRKVVHLKPAPLPSAPKTCAVPGCPKPLPINNTSTVCPGHMHRIGICQCRTCRVLQA